MPQILQANDSTDKQQLKRKIQQLAVTFLGNSATKTEENQL